MQFKSATRFIHVLTLFVADLGTSHGLLSLPLACSLSCRTLFIVGLAAIDCSNAGRARTYSTKA